ncbi:MAG: type II toxin-antitoxin system HicB family antitoxin [Ardenticatenales bacterium]|nr:type II toxin-antitoxin system HicB family antitoxin [Ardenticatenales bacterium]
MGPKRLVKRQRPKLIHIDTLRQEGEISLKVFLEMCAEDGVEPRKAYSGRFNLRIPADLHAALSIKAAATGKSLNQWVTELLEQSIQSEPA